MLRKIGGFSVKFVMDFFFCIFRCGTSMYEMVYRLLLGGVLNKTEHKPSVFSLISELDRAEDAGQLPERIFFGAEEEISMSIECYNPSARLVGY